MTGHAAFEDGSLVTTYDERGVTLFVPYFCRKGCNTGWSTKRARGAHERTHTSRTGRYPKPEPEVGTLQHYHWARRNKVEVPRVDMDVWAEYMRNYYRTHPEKRP